MKRASKKIAWAIIIFFCLAGAPFSPARAFNFTNVGQTEINGIGTGVMNSLFKDLGVDTDELKYNIKTMNVARRKKNPPLVSLSFTPLNPVSGEKVTAEATPEYFLNEMKDLYFTWYLKSKICKITNNTNNLNSEQKKKCDLNKDKKITIEDYKIKAMRIIANNDFEWDKDGDGEPDKDIYSNDSDNDGYRAVIGGNDQNGKNNFCYVRDVVSGEDYSIICEHLFPNAPNYTTGGHYTTGDGSFGIGEESFWRTDPDNEDTADTGNKDEANVAGLGINGFTWTYEQGDEVGLVVEGVSTDPTQKKDSSYKTMWAFSKNKCDNVKTMKSAGYLNDCLYGNLVDPAEGGGATEKLKAELSYSPKSPVNDPDPVSNAGDQVVVNSSVLNARDKNYLKYKWEVYKSPEANPESWGKALLKKDIPESSQTTGLGLDTFKFKLNFPGTYFDDTSNPMKYLKIKLTITENVESGVIREGYSYVVIPINSSSSRIKAYEASVSDSLEISLGSDEICQDGIEKSVCPVLKNEIVGVTVPSSGLSDFYWTIDGAAFSYKECFFEGCDDISQTNKAFFPILKNKGERYTVTLNAINQKTGKKIDLTKVFEVVDPEIKISCVASSCEPVILGYYVDLDGKKWEDLSKINFWAADGSYFKLSAATTGFSVSAENLSWFVDEQAIISVNAEFYGYTLGEDGTITLPPKLLGESYDVTVNAPYTQSNLVKKALNRYWDVTYDQFYETVVSDSVNIEIKDSSSQTASSPNRKILASIYSSVPSYLAFLLRIVLTSFIILIGSVFILSLFPEIKDEKM